MSHALWSVEQVRRVKKIGNRDVHNVELVFGD